MGFVIGALGFIFGLFLWSNILGSLFATLPLEKKLVKAGVKEKIDWTKIIGAIVFAAIVLTLTAVFARTFFFGTLVGGFIMLFNIPKLRGEAIENYQEEQARAKK
jgi:hypothetical protein